MINKREVGACYEKIVCEYLEKNNYKIVTRNFRCKIGEIDIVAEDEGYLSFIEVKYREKDSIASGLYAVDKKKQKTIYNVAKIYMSLYKISEDRPCRFDVVSVDGDNITLIKNAFP